MKHTAQADLLFGLPSPTPFLEAIWYSKPSRSGERLARSPFLPEPPPKPRKIGIVKIAVLGWLVGLGGVFLLKGHVTPEGADQTAQPIVSAEPLPAPQQALALRR
jgi:hypothetical protein